MANPIIVKCRFIPKGFCVNLFGTLWSRDTSWIDKYVINHERIHTAQQRELLFVPFYVLYLLEWFVRLICYCNSFKAYRSISFEQEAYTYGVELGYLKRRKPYAWLRFLGKRI